MDTTLLNFTRMGNKRTEKNKRQRQRQPSAESSVMKESASSVVPIPAATSKRTFEFDQGSLFEFKYAQKRLDEKLESVQAREIIAENKRVPLFTKTVASYVARYSVTEISAIEADEKEILARISILDPKITKYQDSEDLLIRVQESIFYKTMEIEFVSNFEDDLITELANYTATGGTLAITDPNHPVTLNLCPVYLQLINDHHDNVPNRYPKTDVMGFVASYINPMSNATLTAAQAARRRQERISRMNVLRDNVKQYSDETIKYDTYVRERRAESSKLQECQKRKSEIHEKGKRKHAEEVRKNEEDIKEEKKNEGAGIKILTEFFGPSALAIIQHEKICCGKTHIGYKRLVDQYNKLDPVSGQELAQAQLSAVIFNPKSGVSNYVTRLEVAIEVLELAENKPMSNAMKKGKLILGMKKSNYSKFALYHTIYSENSALTYAQTVDKYQTLETQTRTEETLTKPTAHQAQEFPSNTVKKQSGKQKAGQTSDKPANPKNKCDTCGRNHSGPCNTPYCTHCEKYGHSDDRCIKKLQETILKLQGDKDSHEKAAPVTKPRGPFGHSCKEDSAHIVTWHDQATIEELYPVEDVESDLETESSHISDLSGEFGNYADFEPAFENPVSDPFACMVEDEDAPEIQDSSLTVPVPDIKMNLSAPPVSEDSAEKVLDWPFYEENSLENFQSLSTHTHTNIDQVFNKIILDSGASISMTPEDALLTDFVERLSKISLASNQTQDSCLGHGTFLCIPKVLHCPNLVHTLISVGQLYHRVWTWTL